MKKIITDLLSEKNLSKMDFYKKIGMTTTGYIQMMENNSMKVSTLEKIAEVLEVPIGTLFGQKQSETENKEILELLRENRQLRLEIERLKQTANVGTKSTLPKLEKQKK